jgi:alkylated DNA repair protein alkB homolog 7
VSRKRRAKEHWDAVIVKYREFTILDDDPGLFLPFQTTVFDPIRTLILEKHLVHRGADDVKWLPPHAIDLHRDGGILAHVDSTRFSGDVVCGLSLKSTCIMRLRPAGEDGKPDPQQLDNYVDLLLEPRSLYVLQGDGRYKYTHEIMVTNSVFNINGDKPRLVSRDPRLSIIFRDDQ